MCVCVQNAWTIFHMEDNSVSFSELFEKISGRYIKKFADIFFAILLFMAKMLAEIGMSNTFRLKK